MKTPTTHVPALPPRLIARKREAAEWFGISERSLHDLIGEGLPVLRPSVGLVLVDLRAALRWLRERGEGSENHAIK